MSKTMTTTVPPQAGTAVPAPSASTSTSTHRASSAKDGNIVMKAGVRPFGHSARRIAQSAAEELEGNTHEVGKSQSHEANALLNALIEYTIGDFGAFVSDARAIYSQPGSGSKPGAFLKTVTPDMVEAYIRLKNDPDSAGLILSSIEQRRAALKAQQ